MTEWKPYMNPAAGKKKYSLYKTINPDKPDHILSGNRLKYGVWYKTRKEAEEKAKYLNALEGNDD